MTRHHDDDAPAGITTKTRGTSRLTLSNEAERRAHVAGWIAKHHKSASAALGTAMLVLPAVAGAQTAPGSLVDAVGIDGVRDVRLLDDGTARITLDNGRVLNLSAEDVVIGDAGQVQVSGQVADILAEAAAGPAAGGAGGAGGAIAAGAAAAAAGAAAASGGGGGGSGSTETQQVLNAEDVAGFTTFADIFGREPEGDPDRVTISVDGGEGIELTQDEDGTWTLPEHFADNFAERDGEEVTVSFSAEREVPPESQEDDAETIVDDGEVSAFKSSGNEDPEFEEVDSGTVTLLVDTVAPTIEIDGPIAGDDVLNIAESAEDLTITGTTTGAEDGQVVTLILAGETYTGTVNGGMWSVVIPAADLGDLADATVIDVRAKVADAAGNPATPADASFETDFTAPTITIDPIDEIGPVAARDGLDITGTTTDAENDQEVTVIFDGQTFTGSVVDDAWTVTIPAAVIMDVEGRADADDRAEVDITATVEDAAGNPADAPASVTIDADFSGPSITIEPITGDNVINIAERDDAGGVTISGSTGNVGAGQDVTVTVHGLDALVAQTDADGNWSVTLSQQDVEAFGDGDSVSVEADVSDADGIEADTATVTLATDYTAPTIDIDGPIAGDDVLNIAERDEGITVSGTTDAEIGQEVTVTLSRGVGMDIVVTGTVAAAADPASSNEWSVNLTSEQLQDLGPEISVDVAATVEDAAGNPAAPAETSFETDFTPPTLSVQALGGLSDGQNLTASDLLDANGAPLTDPLTVTGTSDATGQEVTVTLGALSKPATVAGDDTWSVDFTPTELLDQLSGQTDLSILATVADAARNPNDAALDLDVDLRPEVTIAAPAEGAVLGLDAFEGGLDVSGATEFVPDGQDVIITLRDDSDTVVATTTGTVTDGAWTGAFQAGDIAGLTDESPFSLQASVNNGFAAQDAEATQAITTDFQPEITVDEIGEEGVLILADIDPNDATISGTTRGVEAGQAVTVTILDAGGATIFTDEDNATVAADGTWTLDLPSAALEALEAGQTYDVKADVSNAAGRDAPQANQEVITYLPAPFTIEETARSGTDVTYDVITDLDNVNGSGISQFAFTLTFDDAIVSIVPATTELVDEGTPSEQEVATGGLHPQISIGERTPNDVPDGVTSVFGARLAGSISDFSNDPIYTFDMNILDETQVIRLSLNSDVADLAVNETQAGPSISYIGTSQDDTIIAENVDTLIRGRGGDDTIDLSGAGVNTVLFEADPTANGFDTVTDFSIGGPLPDRLGFAGLDNADLRGDGDAFELLSGTDSVGANTGLIVFTTAMADLNAGSVQAAINDLDGPADGDLLYFLASDGTDAQLYQVRVQDGPDTVTDMAHFAGLGDLSGMTEANILGFDTSNQGV